MVFLQVCSISGPDWNPTDKVKKAQFMSSRRHGGSGMVPFEVFFTSDDMTGDNARVDYYATTIEDASFTAFGAPI